MNDPADPGACETLHASAVVIGEAGVVIRGRSGRGKSALALALIELAAERGLFSRLIGDDRISARKCADRVLISGFSAVKSLIERRGVGLVTKASEPAAVARLVVDLLDEGETASRMPDEQEERAELAAVSFPRLVFDARSRPFERARAVLDKLTAETTGL
jgi:HPr kinase/phosphorylase